MNRGRDVAFSNCEAAFIARAITEGKRVDGRGVYDYRTVQIALGQQAGQVEAQLGTTRVYARVSCEAVRPLANRPAEGQLFFNIDFSPMASPSFEIGRPSSHATEISRILDQCFKESGAVDTESLCIIAQQQVWSVRVDVHVLDYGGNVIDCAAIASAVALKTFRRPDVTISGEQMTIHPVTERDPVPLSIHHVPLCVTIGFFSQGEYLVVDPTVQEERVLDGRLTIGLNTHKELCVLHMCEGVAILPEQIVRCTEIAVVKCKELGKLVKSAYSGVGTTQKDMNSILKSKKEEEACTWRSTSIGYTESKEQKSTYSIKELGDSTAKLEVSGDSLLDESETSDGEGFSENDKLLDVTISSEEEMTIQVTEKDVGGFKKTL